MKLEKLRDNARNKKPDKVVVFRATKEEFNALKKKARKHTKSNLSEFIRHAILAWNPQE